MLDAESLKALGAFSLDMLRGEPEGTEDFIVTGLIAKATTNILVGNTGIGKTALGLQLSLCVAAGKPFLDYPTASGTVLYVDLESGQRQFNKTLAKLGDFLGLSDCDALPLVCYNPLWDTRVPRLASTVTAMTEVIKATKPILVVIDPMRRVWPGAEMKSDACIEMINEITNLTHKHGCAWLITHHLRKASTNGTEPADLFKDPWSWFEEAAGSKALITSADTRIGVEKETKPTEPGDLNLCGYRRLDGALAPMKIKRDLDDATEAKGYVRLTGLGVLTEAQREHFRIVPSGIAFSGRWIRDEKDWNGKTAKGFFDAWKGAGLITQDPKTHLYRKVA